MQDMIMLGCLMEAPMTGYQIKKMMEQSTEFFFNTSLGSIYPALQKLEKQALVKMEQRTETGRVQKIYTITEEGKVRFQAWLNKKMSLPKLKYEALLKIFFFKWMDAPSRKNKIAELMTEIDTQIHILRALEKRCYTTTHFAEAPDQYMMLTLKFGIDFYQFKKNWLETNFK